MNWNTLRKVSFFFVANIFLIFSVLSLVSEKFGKYFGQEGFDKFLGAIVFILVAINLAVYIKEQRDSAKSGTKPEEPKITGLDLLSFVMMALTLVGAEFIKIIQLMYGMSYPLSYIGFIVFIFIVFLAWVALTVRKHWKKIKKDQPKI